tara:strand:+ start:603 stop:1067 length:465 start_codon:yes stop_codon:yes gene_type:complete
MAQPKPNSKSNTLPQKGTPQMRLSLIAILPCILTIAACVAPDMPEQSDGAAFFADNCVSCHGRSAKGDGPLAAGLAKAPRDLTLLARDNGGRFPETKTLAYIYGDPLDNHMTRVMPEFGEDMALDLVPVDLDGQITPTPRVLAGLLIYLESIQR